MRQPSIDWAHELLAHVGADCSYDEWIRIAFALKDGLGDDQGWSVFDEWSGSAPERYDPEAAKKTWDSAAPEGGVTWATLVHAAKEGGWKPVPMGLMQRWPHRDVAGHEIAVSCRIDLSDGSKRPYLERNGSKGLKGYGLKNVPLIGTEQLGSSSAADRIYIVEGGPSYNALRDHVSRNADESAIVLATGGTSHHPTTDVLKPIAQSGIPIVCWPDCEASGAGVKHMEKLAGSLIRAGARSVQIIDVSVFDDRARRLAERLGKPDKGYDCVDWIDEWQQPSLAELVAAARKFEPPRLGRPPEKGARQEIQKYDADGRPVITMQTGEERRWWREALEVLLEATEADPRHGFFESTASAVATDSDKGTQAVLVRLLRRRTQGEGLSKWRHKSRDDDHDSEERFGWSPGELYMSDAPRRTVKVMLIERAAWYRQSPSNKKRTPSTPKDSDAADIIELYQVLCDAPDDPGRLPLLKGIVYGPTIRSDGTILDTPSYDHQSNLYADFNPDGWPKVPDEPKREHARAALNRLYDTVSESPFANNTHRAAFAAGVLTNVARNYIKGNVPLFAVSGNQRGVGKGTICDIASAIAYGRPAAKWAPVAGRAGDRDAEEQKRLLSIAINGTPMLCIDNVKAAEPFGTPALEGVITAAADSQVPIVGGRLLGKHLEVKVPWTAVIWVNGNNLTTRGDLDRRGILIRLHTDEEYPENHQYKRKTPVDHVLSHRKDLLIDCLTILRAYKLARERNDPTLPKLDAWGSFVAWGETIREAIVWADEEGCDPVATNKELKAAHPEQAQLMAVLGAWYAAFGDGQKTSADIRKHCKDDENGDLMNAISETDVRIERGEVNTKSLGGWLNSHVNRPGKYTLKRDVLSRKWHVERGVAADSMSAPQQAITDLLIKQEWSDEQVERALRLLNKLVKGQIVNDGRLLFGIPAYSYMENKQGMQSDAFKQAYERLPSIAERQSISIEEAIAFLLAEKYLVQADEKLGGFGTADQLSFEAARLMTAAMSAASNGEFTPEAGIIKSELVRIIERLLGRDHDAATVGDHPVSEADRDAPGDTETGDRSVPRCVGCSTTEGRIVRRALRAELTPRYGLACEACAESGAEQRS